MDLDLNERIVIDVDDPSMESTDLANEEYYVSNRDIARQIEKRLEVGSEVEDIDEAYILYCEYARSIGFNVRKGSQKYFSQTSNIRMKEFNCSCEGQPDGKRSMRRIVVYKKQVTRSNCKARIRVLRVRDGPWRISIFDKVHNHELVDPYQSYLLRSARNLTIEKKSMLETLYAAGIPVSRACEFMEKESGHRQNVGFLLPDAYAHISRLKHKSKIENGDAIALLEFFVNKSNNDPLFYCDDEG